MDGQQLNKSIKIIQKNVIKEISPYLTNPNNNIKVKDISIDTKKS